MVARKPSVIYQTKCVLCHFVTFYMTHVVVFSSLSSLFFSFWNCMKCIYFPFQLVSNNSCKIHEFLFCMKPVGSLLLDCCNPQEATKIRVLFPSTHLLFIHSQMLYDFLYGRSFMKFIYFVQFSNGRIFCVTEIRNFVFLKKKYTL